MTHPFYFTWTKQNEALSFPFEKASGSYFYIDGENKVLDFTSTSYQVSFGHSPSPILNKVKGQLDDFSMASAKAVFPLKERATKRLLDYMQEEEGKIFYTVSGAEAVENALKMARQVSGKKIILARTPSYHGATLGALSVTGDWRNGEHETIDEWVRRIPEPHEDPSLEKTRHLIEAVGPEKIAGFCLETITGNNGVFIQDQVWWDGIQKLCRDYKLLLIIDEVICGFQRTGKAFGYHHYDIRPDFICMAKGISGGVIPFGAVWTTKEIANYYEEQTLSCGLTNYAHPLGLAAMEGVFDILEDQSFHHGFKEALEVFEDSLAQLKKSEKVLEIRQKGLLAAIDLQGEAPSFQDFFQAGIYLIAQKERIILAPALNMEKSDIELGFKMINKVLGI